MHIPIIVACGIMNGANIKAKLNLGAAAVQMGTAFLACDEAVTNAIHRQALLNVDEVPTELTRVFSSCWAGSIKNRFPSNLRKSTNLLPFPAQNALTRDIRAESLKQRSR